MAASLALALASCGLPAHSDIRQGLAVDDTQTPPVRFAFEAPRRGADPPEVVRGFLAANWDSDEDYQAARAHLSAAAAKAWEPRSRVTVYRGGGTIHIESLTAHTVRVTGEVVGEMDGAGRYVARPAGTTRSAVLTLAQIAGEWRIQDLADDFGLWLNRSFFVDAYRQVDVAYAVAERRVLVPDRRWLPVGPGLATSMARAQLQPVPSYLVGAVSTGFPRGVSLSVDAIAVAGNTAQIDLSSPMFDTSPEQRRAAGAQMLATMRQVGGVSEVSLRVDGNELDPAGGSLLARSAADLGFSAPRAAPESVVLRRGQRLHRSTPQSFPREDPTHAPSSVRLPVVAGTWTDVAVSGTLADVAAVSGDRRTLRRWRGERAVDVPVPGRSLTAPAYDALGHLWVGAADASGAARLWTAADKTSRPSPPTPVGAEWLRGRTVEAVLPAPDGARVAVLSSRRGRLAIQVAGIVRDADGLPRSLTRPRTVGGDVLSGSAPAWADDSTLVLLGRTEAAGPVRPLLVTVGGLTESLAAVPDARRVVSLGGPQRLVLLTGSGRAWSRVSGGWREIDAMTDLIPVR